MVQAATTAKPGSWFSLFLAAFAGLGCLAALFIVMLQFGGPLAIVAVLILVLGGLVALMHYLVWGWWLSKAIHEEVAKEEREKNVGGGR